MEPRSNAQAFQSPRADQFLSEAVHFRLPSDGRRDVGADANYNFGYTTCRSGENPLSIARVPIVTVRVADTISHKVGA